MKARLVLREAWQMVASSKVPSFLVVLLVMTMCAGTILTVGRTGATEAQVRERLESAGSRLLIVTDTSPQGQHVSPAVVYSSDGLSTVERAVGLLNAIDVVIGEIGRGGEKVPAWGITGNIAHVAELTGGSMPGPGEAIVSGQAMDRLGLDEPVGWTRLESDAGLFDLNVVGSFAPRPPFEDYGTGILYVPPTAGRSDRLEVILGDSHDVQSTQLVILHVINAPVEDLRIESLIGAAELQRQVLGDVSTFGRALLLGVLGAGAALVAVVTLTDVLVRRADLGRRRALGATRLTIITLVMLRTAYAAFVGALLGTVIAGIVTGRMDAAPPMTFMAGVGVLSIIAAIVSTLPPAVFTAQRDPVGVLRTP